MAKLTELADSAANFLKQSERKIDEDQLRDFLDRWSQGDLDCLQLALLADMVKARLAVAQAAKGFLKHAILRKGERKKLERIAKGMSP